MKSKKLFAILTLVAFMMTLVPAMAFGAVANRYASSIDVDVTTVDATGEDFAEITVYLFDGSNNTADDRAVYVASDRVGCEKFYEDDEETLLATTAASNVFVTPVSDDGVVEFHVASKIAGEATIAVGLTIPTGDNTTSLYNYLLGVEDVTAETVGLIDTQDITFEAGSLDDVVVKSVKDKGGVAQNDSMDANGSDYYEITFQVQNKANAGVSGEDVKFSANRSGLRMSKTTATTDAKGMVSVKVYGDKADTYKVKATCGKEYAEATVIFGAGTAFEIELVSDNNQKIALDQTNKQFEVKVSDLRGNVKEFGNAGDFSGVMESAEVISEPTGSDIEGTINYTLNTDGDPVVKIGKFKKEGDYVVRAALKNGKYVDISFTVKEQGDIVAVSLEYDETALMLEGVSGRPTVKRLDAEGISLDAAGGLEFFSSDLDKATVDSTTGVVTATDDDDYLGDVTITVVDKDENKTGSAVISICDYARSLKFEVEGTTATGDVAEVIVKTVDRTGKVVAVGDNVAAITTDAWIVSAPADSTKGAAFDTDFEKDLRETGAGILEVDCDTVGTVKVQVKVAIDFSTAASDIVLTGIVEVPFSKVAAPIQGVGAKSVTMFIGNSGYVQDGVAQVTDCAPFIKDGRTFVAVRPIADAFGCEIGWNEATQTVTLTREDITVTIVIGSSDITVTNDGVVETVEADVPAFIQAEYGRTVLPFRAIGNAFGATVNYDEATQSVSYTQQ